MPDYMLFLVAAVFFLALAWRLYGARRGRPAGRALERILPAQFIIADIETTGLDPLRHEIIEIAAIRVHRDSEHHDTFQALVRPRRKVSRRITSITGITNEMLEREGEELEAVMREFLAFIGDRRLVFFNAAFDVAFLQAAAVRASCTLDNPVTCALAMAKEAWPGLSSYRLTDLGRMAGVSTDGAHRALKDCQLTMGLYGAAASVLKRA